MIDIHEIDLIVRKYFSVYEARLTPEFMEYKIVPYSSDSENLDSFRKLWQELKRIGYLPTMMEEKNEYVLRIIPFPRQKTMPIYVNVILLIITLISTIMAGAMNYAGYFNEPWLSIESILGGALFFALPLMAILGLHELGHYFAARKNGVRASLPFFLPAPSIIGTLGAFISLREPIPDRKALLEIGASGPIVGFLVAIPIAIFGNYLGTIMHPTITDSLIRTQIYPPLIYNIINLFVPTTSYMFPMAFAAWVGFVVTAINLLPVGQLDGGHIARALLGNRSKYLSYAFFIFLLIVGFFYLGWLIFALFILILGLNHPPSLNDISRIGKGSYVIGIIAILLIGVTFVPIPISEIQLNENILITTPLMHVPLVNNCLENYSGKINIVNTGDKMENITVKALSPLNVEYDKFIGNLSVNSHKAVFYKIWIDNQTRPGNYTVSFIFTTVLEGIKGYYNLSVNVFNQTDNIVWNNPQYYVNQSIINESFTYTGNSSVIMKIWPMENASIIINRIVMNNTAEIMVNPNDTVNITVEMKNQGIYYMIIYYNDYAGCLMIHYV